MIFILLWDSCGDFYIGDEESEIFCCEFDPNDKYVACGSGDSAIRIFNVQSGKMAFMLANPHLGEFERLPITCLRWRPVNSTLKTHNVLVATCADGSIQHWHATSGKCMHVIKGDEDNHLYGLDYHPDGDKFAVCGKDTSIRIYDESTKSVMTTLHEGSTIPGHSNRVFSVHYNKDDPNIIVSGGWDNNLIVYDVRKETPVANMYGPHICGDSIDVLNGKILAGSYDSNDNLSIFDMKMMKKECVIDWFDVEF